MATATMPLIKEPIKHMELPTVDPTMDPTEIRLGGQVAMVEAVAMAHHAVVPTLAQTLLKITLQSPMLQVQMANCPLGFCL